MLPRFILYRLSLFVLLGCSCIAASGQFFSVLTASGESAPLPACIQQPHLQWQPVFKTSSPFSIAVYQAYHAGYPVAAAHYASGHVDGQRLLSGFAPQWPFATETKLPSTAALWVADSAVGQYVLCSADTQGSILSYVQLSSGRVVQEMDMLRYFATDTSAAGKVFLPDPISSSRTTYGQVYKDRNDSAFALPYDQQFSVQLPARLHADTFTLYHPSIVFTELSPPLTPHAWTLDSFVYNRQQPEFEEVNVFYHLLALQQWWKNLGFAAWCDTVQVDVHAYSGADESAFNPLVSPPSIEFGDGGVDDAEDADAIVHEYTHAASHAVRPGAYAGTQRQAVEEGICDFMAVCYSHRYNRHQPSWVYNWDGHNVFWAGRDLDNARVYPGSLTNQIHVDGQLFGAALYALSQEIGEDTAVALTLAALPFLGQGLSMPQAAQVLLQVDSLRYAAKFHWPLVKALYPRGLLPQVGLQEVASPGVLVYNSAGFALGQPMWVQAPTAMDWQLLDAAGRMVLAGHDREFTLEPQHLVAGVYVLRIAGTSVLLQR